MRVRTTRTDLYIEMTKEGLSISEIARRCNVSKQAVHSALKIAKSKGINVSYYRKIVPIDDETKNTILELYEQYNSLEDIAKVTGVCTVTVTETVREAREKGLVKRPAKSRSGRYQKIIKMINEGYRPKEISAKLNYPINQVYNYIAKAKKANMLINYDPRFNTRKWVHIYNKAIELYNAGYNYKDMTDKLNVCECTLYKALSEAKKNSDIIYRKEDDTKYRKFIELYNKGYSRRGIAKELGVAVSTVGKYVIKAKKDHKELITRSTSKYSQDIKDKVTSLYNEGYKYKDIATEMNMSVNAVAYIISDVRMRSEESITRPKRSYH